MPPAQLTLIAIPIGNNADLSPRAQQALEQTDIIAAEDTRKAGLLLKTHGISTSNKRFLAHHAHNEKSGADGLIKLLKEGNSIAYISDAGTPGISDPGTALVAAARAEGIPVHGIPGACAAITALSISGLPTSHFTFIGFLPRKKGDINKTLTNLQTREETLIFYESPRRLLETLEHLSTHFGKIRPAFLARELTKTHEEHLGGTLDSIYKTLTSRQEVLGECCLIVSGHSPTTHQSIDLNTLNEEVKQRLKTESLRTIRDDLSTRLKLPKKLIYQHLLNLTDKNRDK